MKRNIKVSSEEYAILKAYSIKDSKLVITEKCPFCNLCHTHVNPKKDDRSDTPLRKSHCLDKSLVGITEDGLVVGNRIYYLEVQDDTVN